MPGFAAASQTLPGARQLLMWRSQECGNILPPSRPAARARGAAVRRAATGYGHPREAAAGAGGLPGQRAAGILLHVRGPGGRGCRRARAEVCVPLSRRAPACPSAPASGATSKVRAPPPPQPPHPHPHRARARGGVVDALLKCGAIVPGKTNIAGLSGGAFTAVWTTLGLTGEQQFDFWKDVITTCAQKFQDTLPGECGAVSAECKAKLTGCEGRGFAVVKEILDEKLADDAHRTGEHCVG